MAFPVIEATATGRITTASTSHSITLPSGVVAGELLFVLLAVDPSSLAQVDINVSSGTGWYKFDYIHDGSALSSAVFWKFATGSDSLTLSTDTSQTSAHFSARISGAGSFAPSVGINAPPADPGPAWGGTNRAYEILNLLVNVNDGNVTGVTPPSGFTSLTTDSSPNATTGASIITAYTTSYQSRNGLNPGTWTATFGATSLNTWHFAFSEQPWNDGCPSIIARQETKNNTAATSHTIRLPGNINRGDFISVWAGVEAAATLSVNTGSSGNGWIVVAQASQATTGPTGIILYKIADGNDALVLTSSVSSTLKGHSMIWANAGHMIGNLVGGASGAAADPDLAETAGSGVYDSDTATGFGGNYDQPFIAMTFFLYNSASYYGSGAGGTPTSNTVLPSMSYEASPWHTDNVNAISWGNWVTTPSAPWVVGVATVFPKFVRQPRVVGSGATTLAGGSGTSSLTFSSATGYLTKIPAGSGSGGQTSISFDVDGIDPGDMILAVNAVGTSGRNPALAVTGYTTLADVLSDGSTYDTRVWAGYKFMGQTVDTSVTFPRSGNNSDAQIFEYFIVRGINPDTVTDGDVIIRTGSGTGVPTDYTVGTWAGVAAARTSPLLSRNGNNYLRIGAGAAATSVALVPPSDNWFTLSRISSDTNDVHCTMSWVFPTDYPEGWADVNTDLPLTTGWTGGTTNAADSWVEIIIRLDALPRPRHGALLKVWNGTAWVPQDIRVYNGTEWKRGAVRHWNGNRWVNVTTNQFQ